MTVRCLTCSNSVDFAFHTLLNECLVIAGSSSVSRAALLCEPMTLIIALHRSGFFSSRKSDGFCEWNSPGHALLNKPFMVSRSGPVARPSLVSKRVAVLGAYRRGKRWRLFGTGAGNLSERNPAFQTSPDEGFVIPRSGSVARATLLRDRVTAVVAWAFRGKCRCGDNDGKCRCNTKCEDAHESSFRCGSPNKKNATHGEQQL